jgi:hypothetical protein
VIAGVEAKGYVIVSPRGLGQWSGIVSFTSPAHHHSQIAKMLRADRCADQRAAAKLKSSRQIPFSQGPKSQVVDTRIGGFRLWLKQTLLNY